MGFINQLITGGHHPVLPLQDHVLLAGEPTFFSNFGWHWVDRDLHVLD